VVPTKGGGLAKGTTKKKKGKKGQLKRNVEQLPGPTDRLNPTPRGLTNQSRDKMGAELV